MLVHELVGDVDVVELEARQLGLVGVGLGVEPRTQQVDDLDLALLPRPRLEQLLLAGADGSLLHRPLDDREALGDLVGIGRGAVPAEQELADVGRDRVLAAELLGEVLADEVALEDVGGEPVELVERRSPVPPHHDLTLGKDLPVGRDEHEVGALAFVFLVGHEQRHLARARRLLRLLGDARRSAPPAAPRRSTMTFSVTPLNSTRHCSPSHFTFVNSGPPTPAACAPACTVRRGTMHSCGLTPPCSYSLFASKQVAPGASAMRTSGSQNQGTVGDVDCGAVLEPGASPLLELGRRRRKLDLLHAAREQDPAVVGDDVDPCPSRVEQLPDAADDPVHLLVEVVDEPHADVVAAVVDLAGFGPRSPDRDRRSRWPRALARRSLP